jgi:hypothetical protein
MTVTLSSLFANSVGPANNDIANAVASNSNVAATIAANGGFGNTYTALTNASWSGATSNTLSWSGTYKKIIIIATAFVSSVDGSQYWVRLNGDSSSYNHNTYGYKYINNAYPSDLPISISNYAPILQGAANGTAFVMTIDNASSSGPKTFSSVAYSYYLRTCTLAYGSYVGTSAINSFVLSNNNSATSTAYQAATFAGIYVYGVN